MAEASEFDRFVEAQQPVYDQVLRELAAGCKRTHWMWFVFPQLRGLGHSATAERFSLDSVAHAERYLAHDVLGPRLIKCTQRVLALPDPDPKAIFGYPDWLKFRSSMTLFSLCSAASAEFSDTIERCFGGIGDERTLELLALRRISSSDLF